MPDQTIQNIGQNGADYPNVPATRGSVDPPVAAKGSDGQQGDKKCDRGAGQGTTGTTGLTGYTGGNGGNGGNASSITMTITEMSGHYTLLTQGGNGGKGGIGGKGGPGQTGGPGGSGTSDCGGGPQGGGGPGGKGGTGGMAGKGGDAGAIIIRYQTGSPTFDAKAIAGVHSVQGSGGGGGDPGEGNPKGGLGDGGDTGPNPTDADNGKPGSILINGVKVQG
ncbi:MAG TPA: hypothetical protein VG294_17990 [Solirubrobacteraceae bacterium]|jgi:hypothetical protein|nr:hypothetical protein [Solirubrobacteraceae bacterium]